MYHTEHFKEIEIWQLADKHIVCDKRIEFRGDITLKNVKDVSLSIDYNNEPQFHANIIGWPMEKDLLKARALELALLAKLKIRSQE